MKQKAKKRRGRGALKALFAAIILVIAGAAAYYFLKQDEIEAIDSFEACAAYGFPVLESHPRQCVTLDGRIFYEEIKPECASYLDCWQGFYCRNGRCEQFIPETGCEKDEDCLLIDGSLGFGCCWAGRCEPIDMSKEKWIAVKKEWFEDGREESCPREEECGPAPMCATRVINDDYSGKCVNSSCLKLEKEFPMTQKSVKPDEAFSLKINEVAKIEGAGLEIRLLDVTEDSRCPKGAVCVWAGRVAATLGIAQKGDYSIHNISYRVGAAAEPMPAGIYSLTVLGAEPYPEEGATINKRDYSIRLIASRKNPAGIDVSCRTNEDCEVKNVGSLCGGYLQCVNRNFAPKPPELDIGFCGPEKIEGCICMNNMCIETVGGRPKIN